MKDLDGFGELPGTPGTAAEFAQDALGVQLGVLHAHQGRSRTLHKAVFLAGIAPARGGQPGRTIEDTQRGAKAREAAMRLRAHRRNLVVWSPSAGSAGRYGAPWLTRLALTRRIYGGIRTGALLMVIGLMRLARALCPRWRLLLAGGVLTVVGGMLRGAWGVVFLPGLLFLLSALLVPARPKPDCVRRAELERGLGVFSHPAQRRLASQAIALYDKQFPGF